MVRGRVTAVARPRRCLLALTLMFTVAMAVPAPQEEPDLFRLDGSVIPDQYTIRLQPDLDNAKFKGEVTILATAKQDTDTIILHADGMIFSKISVIPHGDSGENQDLYTGKVVDEEYERFIINLDEDLTPEKQYNIHFEYEGQLGDLYGFYISKYYDSDGEERTVAATHFQPTHARKAFPCFDEPKFKAQFKITLVIPDLYNAVSNMPQETEQDAPESPSGFKEVTFENSMVMSPYLVAFAVVDFDKKNKIYDNFVFTSWARKNAIDEVTFGLDITPSILQEAEKYTGIPYTDPNHPASLTKLEQIALPDFPAGAMEDWGLIVYRESRMLFNDGSEDDRSSIATVIGHEIAHMWFGNLVTTAWWDALWLNEGFARYFEHYFLDKADLAFRKMDLFVVDILQGVMASDASASSKPLTWPASSADNARERFTTISYGKGASFLRMVSSIIGEENFQKALQAYLEKNKYKSVLPEDLFQELMEYAVKTGLPEEQWEDFLITWTTVPGFPVVHVERNYVDNTALVSQKRFLFKGASEEQYYVPLTWTQLNQDFRIQTPQNYLIPEQSSLEINIPDTNSWAIFNVQESGYYRVNYDEENWKLIINYLKDYDNPLDSIHVLNRAQLLDDAFNLARAGLLSYTTAFELASYLPREHDYVPWAAALSAFSYLERMFASHHKYPVLQRYIRRLLVRQYERFDFGNRISEGMQHDERLLLNRITSRACAVQYEKCTTRASAAFQSFINNDERIDPDLRTTAYCYGIKNADQHWEDLLDIYLKSTNDAERARLVSGLGCSGDSQNLTRLLSLAVDGKSVRKQDSASVFSAVYATPFGAEVVLEFLSDEGNFKRAQDYLYININSNIKTVISGVASRFTTGDQREKLREFLTLYSEELGTSSLQTTQDNIDWIAENQGDIFSILERIELEQYRLQNAVTPINYQIYLKPFIEARTFEGEVTITVEVVNAFDTIVLHAHGLQNLSISAVSEGSLEELYDYYSVDIEHDFLQIHLKEIILEGTYYINIEYTGTLRDDMYGFYYSTYYTAEGEKRSLAATQFQPTHARKAFPCFDEPQYKATFDISILTPPQYHSLSNMPQMEQEIREDGTLARFLTSVSMSTYLVAFVVSDFEYEEDREDNKVLFRTWTREDALPWAEYSLQISRTILEALEEYTDIKYTDAHPNLNKIDQVAIPDFSAGAMENWGLITYRETALLYNGGPATAQKRVATVIAHELAHMWFGNLVTTKSWDSTWLNEGFAQYFQYYATDKTEPSWRIMDQFLVDVQQAVYRSDMLASAQALTATAYTPSQISARFGTITYSKGASFIRMLESVLLPGNLRDNLQTYLNKHKFGVTDPGDLFECLKTNSNEATLSPAEMEAFLISWTEQPGFPLITVTRNYEANTATVTQERFHATNGADDETLYFVPLTWAQQEGGNDLDFSIRAPQSYIPNNVTSVVVPGMPKAEFWVVFNVQETGYYRVNYDKDNWALITRHLAQGGAALNAIHVLNRAQLVDDAFNLARGGYLPYATAFDLADYLKREDDFIPWTAAATAFNYLDVMLAAHNKYHIFQTYILQLLDKQYQRFRFQDQKTHVDRMHLNRITSLACSLGHEHCRESAENALGDHFDNDVLIPGDLRSIVYCYGVRNSPEYWDKLWTKYTESLDDAERQLIASGLGCSSDTDTLKKYLQYSIDEEYVRRQDASSVFTAVYSTRVGVDVALEFLDENFHEIQNYYGSMNAINSIMMGISARLTTEKQQERLEEFVADHANDLGLSGTAALETVQENLDWLEKNADDIIDILEAKIAGDAASIGGTALSLVIALTVIIL